MHPFIVEDQNKAELIKSTQKIITQLKSTTPEIIFTILMAVFTFFLKKQIPSEDYEQFLKEWNNHVNNIIKHHSMFKK